MSKLIKITSSASKKKDKQPAASFQLTLEENLFQAPLEYQNYLQMGSWKVKPIKCIQDKFLVFTHLP